MQATRRNLTLFLVSLLLLCTLGLGIWIWRNTFTPKKPAALSSRSPDKTRAEFKVMAWSPDWAATSSMDSLNAHGSKLSVFAPVWYEMEPSGSLKSKRPANADELIRAAKAQGLMIMVTIAEFDHDIFSSVLQDQANLERHVQSLLELADKDRADGLDLDYESTKLADKDKYFELLQKVSAGLKAKNKKLNVTVLAQWGDQVEYKSLRETRKVQDWSKIAQYADTLTLMAYDYTGNGSAFPGPVGPLSWQEEVVKYATAKVTPEKIILGTNLYSYEKFQEVDATYPAGNYDSPQLKFVADWQANEGQSTPTRSYTYQTVSDVVQKYKGQSEDRDGEKIFRYTKPNGDTGIMENRLLVYVDQDGIRQRYDLAKKYNLGGLAFWRLGAEGDILEKLPDVQG